MYSNLLNFLEDCVGVERIALYMDGLETLEKHGDITPWTQINTNLQHMTDKSTSELLDMIEQILHSGIDKALRAYTVMADIDQLAGKVDLLRQILSIEDFELKTQIYDIVYEYTDACEAFCDLLSLVSGYPPENYFTKILTVSDSLLTRICEEVTAYLDDGTQPVNASEARQTAISQFAKDNPMSLMATAIREDRVMIGTPIDYLLQTYNAKLTYLEPAAPDAASKELVGLYLLSDVPTDLFATAIKDQLDQIFSTLDFMSAVGVSVDKHVLGALNRG